EREFAIRTALGARRGRLARQLLTESTVLAGAGGLLGFGLAALGLKGLVVSAPSGIPRLDEIKLDTPVFIFTFGVSVLAGLLFGLVPAWKVSRTDPSHALKEGGGASSGALRLKQMRGALVVAEC